MSSFLGVIVFIGFIISFVYAIFFQQRVLYERFNVFLQRFDGAIPIAQGLSAGLPSYNTTYNRRPLRISLRQSRVGRHKKTYSHFHMNVNDPTFEFVITKQDLLSNIGKLLGMQDIEIGDEAFDKAFIIKTTSRERFIEVFNFEIRSNLMSNESGNSGTLRLSAGKLSYEMIGSFQSESFNNHFGAIIELAAKIAERIDSKTPQLVETSHLLEVPASPKIPTAPRPIWNDWPENEEYLKRLTRDVVGGQFRKEVDRCFYVTQYKRRELVLEYFYKSAPRVLNISLTVTQKFWLRMVPQSGDELPDEIRMSDPYIDKTFRIHSDQKEAATKFLESVSKNIGFSWLTPFDRFEINKGRAMFTIANPKRQNFLRSALEQTLGNVLKLLQAYEEQRLTMSISQSTSKDNICPYCREDLNAEKEQIVTCKLCHTAHHQSCLNENKQCTTWGCLATESDFA